ncbi:hypothetical protein GOZ97_03230 [Agrobacterium vitis]|uniref:O-linked N-acetylglucosamine transferase, SPINDLY family protein n=1 Tax=Rhizobium/Agrobacterium group TaxID=227290 RepID=UPI0008DC1889|nr:hypothetical protein [Agrobacterium vitis]MCF1434625.1 hypothetical protein [Allorhizobium ampelinum]MUO88425.1 hypothetical protein [Agrobacterium vitis]MUZ54459.1 hypothetical protein [Agrobacterium vitis]MUZ90421.1 hypothetical protein [Agrobacterium vitis]MVA40824.1 hypothetical protein [Agrobacterium vitis]
MATLELVLSAYQSGDLDQALALADATDETDPDRIADLDFLTGGIRLKQADRAGAAKAFLKVAHSASAKANDCLVLAIDLMFSESQFEPLAGLVDLVAKRLADHQTAVFKVVTALSTLGRLGEAHAIIGALDCEKRPHLNLLIAFIATSRDRDALYAILLANAARYPNNAFLLAALALRAHERCDFAVTDHFAARLREPGFGERLAAFELGLARIIRTDDEREAAKPFFGALEVMRHRAQGAEPLARRAIRPQGRLRIAYFSSDLRLHPMMTLIYDALLQHDRSRFDIILLCHSPVGCEAYQSTWPEQLRGEVVRVRDLSSAAIIEWIRQNEVDILVDLNGHTARARLDVVDLCDAPVKVTYMGFPGAVIGVDLDYAITDPIITPDSSKPYYQEKLCRLPETYMANSVSSRTWQQRASRESVGLPSGRFVFGSFNGSQKIDRQAIRIWAQILKRVPEAVLSISCARAAVADNLRAAFAQQGIDAGRLIFFDNCPSAEFLARMSATDLVLDTFIYNGHTTTSDALWAGVPVLTKKGKAFAGRVSESLLKAVGLPELVAQDADDFIARAVDLAEHPDRLEALRMRLRTQILTAPLFDAERFTRHLERGYEMMAERARAGLQPDHIDVPALPARKQPFFTPQEAGHGNV